FDFFLPLHQLWLEYIKDLKGSLSPELFLEKLVKADFHGALLTVTRTLNPSLLGHTGILARETSTTFHCITRENKMVAIPKQGSVFTVAFDGSLYTLYGNTLRYRSAERSARKFKPKPTIDL
ncbi:RNase P/RNase MRP complex subunit, partial [Coelomomyces lativittatus]